MVAASTDGGFSVRLPLKFNDFTVEVSDPKAPTLRAFEKGQDLGSAPESVTPQRRASDVAYQRAVMLESDLLLMIVESPRSHDATAQQFVAPFFDSLVVTDK